ncbi:sulfite exporter TauE/SafE family protein [Helicobacter acinonychis]|uniref:sulfite exporter TauE/SafE family protein n=1 Tax=Helicobacter acinonychis TaxID=212 RepID=UPI0018F85127|nr:sulfite exporter TauE/SafE family protein [Helicobacter acinonychis]
MQMMQNLSFLGMFLAALSMSLGHCVGMCGGIVSAFSQIRFSKTTNFSYQLTCHALYNLGRISTYMLLGAMVAGLGHSISVGMGFRGALLMSMGIVLILLALLGSKVEKLSFEIPFISLLMKKTLQSQSVLGLYFLGVLNGFLPCMMVYSFLASVILSHSAFTGAMLGLSFGLGTSVPLFLMGIFLSKISASYRKFFNLLSKSLMGVFGLYVLYMGIMLINHQIPHVMHHQNGVMHHQNDTTPHQESHHDH